MLSEIKEILTNAIVFFSMIAIPMLVLGGLVLSVKVMAAVLDRDKSQVS